MGSSSSSYGFKLQKANTILSKNKTPKKETHQTNIEASRP
jgi:hypothetical protein